MPMVGRFVWSWSKKVDTRAKERWSALGMWAERALQLMEQELGWLAAPASNHVRSSLFLKVYFLLVKLCRHRLAFVAYKYQPTGL